MKKIFFLPMIASAMMWAAPASAQTAETPIITFKTTLYDDMGTANAFHFSIGATTSTYIDVDFGFGPVEVEVEQATFDGETSAINATTIPGSVGEDGTVKIYGDASLIDYLDLEGVYITDLDIAALTNLEILNLNHNQLRALDLSGFPKLQAAYLSDNPFGTSPLKIGPDKPDLTILEMSNVGAVDQSLNISDYPALVVFDAYGTHDLRTLDPTGCPGLLRLSIDCTSVRSLDLSRNPELLILDIGETGITNIDLSHNTKLRELYCSSVGSWMTEYKLESLDLSPLPELRRLMCQGNDFTTLDVSHNPLLTDLYCGYNNLPTLDISNNPDIYNLSIVNNVMDFTTMPLPRETFLEYVYYQRRMPVARSYPVGAEVDMSARVMRPGAETWFALFARQRDESGAPVDVELPDDYYSFADGKVTLLKTSTDSLFMAFANSDFPEYDLQTTLFMVKDAADYGKDNVAVTLRTRPGQKQIAMSVGIQGATAESPRAFSVDFGDGKPVSFSATTHGLPEAANASGAVKGTGSMTIYIPEGYDMSALAIDGTALLTLNVDGAPCLTDLSVTNCQLPTVSLPWNRMLVNLDLSHNNLTKLDLTEGDAPNMKTSLRRVDVSYNQLTEFLPGFYQVTYADLSHNNLAEIDLSKASEMLELNLSDNSLTEVDIKDLEAVQSLNLSGNDLSALIIPDYLPLESLDLTLNRFPLSALPVDAAPAYSYAPQKPWQMPAEAPVANLKMQIPEGENATPTTFAWYKADGTPVSDEGIVETSPGLFLLKDTSLGGVYCTFENPAWPDLAGDNVYRTTELTVAEMPTNVAATFVTKVDGIGELVLRGVNDNTTVYVDWEGNGALEQYVVGRALSRNNPMVYAGAEVKVYTYGTDPGLDVFSMAAGPLEYFDGEGLGNLIHLTVNGSGLTEDGFKLPEAPGLEELVLANSLLTDLDLAKKYPNLWMLNVSGNRLTSLDATPWQRLKVLYASQNQLTDVTLDNPLMWELDLTDNYLEGLDVSKVPAMEQLWLFVNKLKSLDVSMLGNLRKLDISENCFNFATLPVVPAGVSTYVYANQEPIEAQPVDGTVDLSGYGAETWKWFLDQPYYDEETGEVYGEQLFEGEEYTIADGVTTFLQDFTNIMCVMQNPAFPKLLLYTFFMDVRVASINEIESEADADGRPAVIYDLQGRRVANPTPGLYIVNGRKVVLR
ncbi:MAG: hypothetical protein K2M12_05375 [Muribaculaceae bacterium]|nr:hypothetical protein [Muribaculaceae bacterium]